MWRTVIAWAGSATWAICVRNEWNWGDFGLFLDTASVWETQCPKTAHFDCSYLAQIAVLHCNLSVEKVHIIPILGCVQEMRFWGRNRSRELREYFCIVTASVDVEYFRDLYKAVYDWGWPRLPEREQAKSPEELGKTGELSITNSNDSDAHHAVPWYRQKGGKWRCSDRALAYL